jgi:hypothetical protein
MQKQIDQIEQINFLKSQLKLSVLSSYLPLQLIEEYKSSSPQKFRERLYPLDVILQTMLFQAISEDKSEQNAVIFLSEYYKNLREVHDEQESFLKDNLKNQPKRRGRPTKHLVKIQKSKLQDISINTASYNESKKRFPLELIIKIVENLQTPANKDNLWNGHRVFVADGTNCDTVDNKELREYFMPEDAHAKASLPIVKIEGLVDLQSGLIVALDINNYRSSEGRMLKVLYSKIPKGTIILGDDLYSSYSHLCYSQSKGCDIIAQGKHIRNDKIVRIINSQDAIVEWRIYKRPSWFSPEDFLPKTMNVRRITYKNPKNPNKELYIYTTLTNELKYSANDIIALYVGRWDIEIGFREIKKILKMEHLRGKTVEMVKKEIYSHWIAYNIIRLLMYKVYTEKDANFFSLREELQTEFAIYQNKDYNIDRVGRSYIRKSPGRYGTYIKEKEKKEKTI